MKIYFNRIFINYPFNRFNALIFLVALNLFSCSYFKNNESEKLAKVDDKILYADDLPNDFFKNLNPKDSLSKLNSFINDWIKEQILLSQINPDDEVLDAEITKKTEEYKKSLLLYEIQKQLVSTNLDSNISSQEITDYYEKNKENFLLKKNLVRLNFVKLKSDTKSLDKLKKLFVSNKEDDRNKLYLLCEKDAENFFLDDSTWIVFEDLRKEIPLNQYSDEFFFTKNKYVELKDNDFIYLILIKEFRVKNSVSPIENEIELIKQIILNQRKLSVWQKLEKDMVDSAKNNNRIEVYTP